MIRRTAAVDELRIAAFLPAYEPAWRWGGPVRTLAAMVAQHGARHRFCIVTGDHDWGRAEPLPVTTDRWVQVGAARVWYARRGRPGSLAGALASLAAHPPDVLYLNGVFPLATTLVPLVCRRLGLLCGQVLLAPRGEFGPGALALHAGRKRIFLRTARALGLFGDVTWHASTAREAAEIRAVVPGARVLVRENESALPERARRDDTSGDERPAGGATPAAGDPRDPPLRLTHLGRLTPKKGLHILIDALAQVTAPVRLDVHGVGDAAYLRECLRAATVLPARHEVVVHGPVAPQAVRDVFAAAEAFAFPTANENFGHTIAEALSVGCPVLAPDTTPWTPVLAAGAGIVVPGLEPAAWAAAIEGLAARGAAGRAAMRGPAADAYDAWAAARPRAAVFDLLAAGPS